ncbi:hypothetical protein ACMA1D_02000 [Streptomyces sp. 796.1]|uniref:hypothetical protein n=1 Tax=Streptomyces sp. 796.1 TaxID=3163029 RepID=UPI0039C8E001
MGRLTQHAHRVGAPFRTAWDGVRPVLRVGNVPWTLLSGSIAIARHAITWCLKATDRPGIAYRVLGLVIAIGTLGKAITLTPILMAPTMIVWGAAALVVQPPEKTVGNAKAKGKKGPARAAAKTLRRKATNTRSKAAADTPDDATEEPPAPAPWPPSRETLHDHIRQAAGPHPGAHLRTLTAHLREKGAPAGWGMAQTRALCTSHEVPVRGSLRAAGAVSPGVHLADLQSPGQPLPEKEPQAPAQAM